MSRLPFTRCQWLLNLQLEKENWTKVLGLFLSPFFRKDNLVDFSFHFLLMILLRASKWAGFAGYDWWARVPSSLGLQVACFFPD